MGIGGGRVWARGLAIIGAASAALAVAPTAQAARRTYVSGNGTSVGGCTRALPCNDINTALSNTSTGGTVVITDSETYAPIVLYRGVTITARAGEEPEISVPSAVYAAVNVGTQEAVTLRHLDVNDPNSRSQYLISSLGDLTLDDVTLSDGRSNTFAGPVTIQNSRITRMTTGLDLQGDATIEHSRVDHCTWRGISGFDFAKVTIENTRIDHNWIGASFSGQAMFQNDRIVYNGLGIQAPTIGGTYATISHSVIGFNQTGWTGNLASYGDNNVFGNVKGDQAPTYVKPE